jgi:hypothetical protein
MIFHIAYEYPAADRDEVHARFLRTGGVPPEGVKMLARWHSVEGNRGFVMAETGDASALAGWMHDWSDFLTFEITPVLSDEDFTSVIG